MLFHNSLRESNILTLSCIIVLFVRICLGPKKDGEICERTNNRQKHKEKTKQPKVENNLSSNGSDQILMAEETQPINDPPPKVKEEDEILCCDGCGCYGMSGEFFNSEACSSACQVFTLTLDLNQG